MSDGHKYEVIAKGPKQISQGETAYLQFDHYSSGALADPSTSYKIAIDCLADNQHIVAASTSLTKDATGKFSYSYTAAADAELGWYKAQAIMASGSDVNKQGVWIFKVVKKVG